MSFILYTLVFSQLGNAQFVAFTLEKERGGEHLFSFIDL